MDSKSAKSRIPISTSKKEQTSDTATPKLDKKEPKTLEMKNTLKPKSARRELNVKTTREVQISKRNVEKTTLLEKAALKNLKPKPQNNNVSAKNIETVSKEMVNLMKTSKTQEIKTNSKFGGTGVNTFSSHTNGASSSHITNAKDAKKDPPKSIVVPKKTTVAYPLYKVSPLRRRSRTELEFNLGRTGPSSTRSSLKIVPNKKKRNGRQGEEVVKKSALKGNETCATPEENVLPKETTRADSIKPLVRSGSISVSKRPPLERKATNPLKFQSKPLRRSKTFHVFDLVPVLKSTTTVGSGSDTIDLDSSKVPGTPDSEHQQKNMLGVNDLIAEVTPKRKIPHGGIFFKTHGPKRIPAAVFNTQSKK